MPAGEKSFDELWLLLKDPSRGAVPDSQINWTNDHKMTLLHCAAREGNWPAAMLLIEKKANLFIEDECKRTVLHFAVMKHCFFAFMLTQAISQYTEADFRPMLHLALNETAARDPDIDPIMVSRLIRILKEIPLEYFKDKHFIEILSEMQLDATTIDQYLPQVIATLNPGSLLNTQSLCQSLEKMAVQGSNLARQLHAQTLQESRQLYIRIAESERLEPFIVAINGAVLKQIALRAIIPSPKIYSDSPIFSKPNPSHSHSDSDDDMLALSDDEQGGVYRPRRF